MFKVDTWLVLYLISDRLSHGDGVASRSITVGMTSRPFNPENSCLEGKVFSQPLFSFRGRPTSLSEVFVADHSPCRVLEDVNLLHTQIIRLFLIGKQSCLEVIVTQPVRYFL